MRRSSRRATVIPANYPATRSSTKDVDKLDSFFSRYADKNDSNIIGPDGVESLCEDLEIDPADFRILLLAWKLEAAKQGYFTQDEWMKGMKKLKADSVEKLQKALATLEKEIAGDPEEFRSLYVFSFTYCLTEPRQKTLDLDSACEMLRLVMKDRCPLTQSFIQFLKEQKDYKGVNMDQWTGFMRFCEEVNPDLSNYDETLAWPLLLDNFVEWSKQSRA